MGLSPQLITTDLYKKAVKELKTLNKNNRAAIRLRAIASAKENGVTVVSKVFNITPNTLRSWVKSYAKSGLLGLDCKPGRGRKNSLLDRHMITIQAWVESDRNITIAKILIKLREECKVISSKSTVHRALQKLNLSYITPRPIHYKQDKSSHQEFKKKSEREIQKKPK